jgi:transposase
MTMKRERFEDLAGTYGADLRRWPEAERAWAERLLAHAPELRSVLDEAAALDALLDASPAPWPSQALRDRVIAAAPRPSRVPALAGVASWAGVLSPAGWSRSGVAFGAGWAAAACAGGVAGMMLTQTLTADVQADAVLYQASLSALDDVDLLG